jgi:hypothetical protein
MIFRLLLILAIAACTYNINNYKDDICKTKDCKEKKND